MYEYFDCAHGDADVGCTLGDVTVGRTDGDCVSNACVQITSGNEKLVL